jgi:glycerol-3-phosphate dehydrogenase
MAEWATDLVCKKLNIDKKCQTAELCLPGSEYEEEPEEKNSDKEYVAPKTSIGTRAAEGRHGSMSKKISAENRYDRSLVCECEEVSIGEVDYAIKELRVQNLINLRRRTRVGMGTCQGELCACRAAGLLSKANGCAEKAQEDLADFLNERWRGMYPVAWSDTLCETQFTSWVYEGICGLDTFAEK